MDSRLDTILELVREPPPADDQFVAKVVERVRADAVRRSRRRRMLTGPAAVAAAAVLIVGGAVAALVRSTESPIGEGRPLAQESKDDAPEPAPRPSRPAAAADPNNGETPSETPAASYRSGDKEWGYESDTTAYAMDHETGLRLETEVYRDEFDINVPQQVTLTLQNTGSEIVQITAAKGCALMVGAYPAEDDDSATPRRSDDDRQSQTPQCAGSDGPQSPAENETFMLAPGEKYVGEATLVLGASGDWGIVGMCQCSYSTPEKKASPSPPTVDNPLDRLGEFGPEVPGLTPQAAPTGADEKLVTPPIRVKAS